MLQGLFVIVLLAVCGWGIFFRDRKPKEIKYDDELSNRIKKIHYINEQINSVEELITDIHLSDDNHHKNISVSWETAVGKSLSTDMWIDGESEVTKQMLTLAQKRREELTTSLFKEIHKLPQRHKQYIIKTTNFFERGGDQIDV